MDARDRRDIDEAHQRQQEVNKAPLADRKEAQATFFEIMRDDPRRVAERLSWLLDGSYGRGEQMLALRVLHSPRMNRVAALTQMIGVYEYQCPEVMTRQAWKRLSTGEKHELARAIEHVIEQAENEDED